MYSLVKSYKPTGKCLVPGFMGDLQGPVWSLPEVMQVIQKVLSFTESPQLQNKYPHGEKEGCAVLALSYFGWWPGNMQPSEIPQYFLQEGLLTHVLDKFTLRQSPFPLHFQFR